MTNYLETLHDGYGQFFKIDKMLHEVRTEHQPILAHGAVRSVLIIGGGDGGMLREVCRHAEIEHITMVEIDQAVVDMCKEYLPHHSQGAYDDPRVNLVIDDGMRFIANCTQQFDVIISDCPDPTGPAEVLFSEDFYHACHRCLTDDGILVAQNGTPFLQLDEVVTTAKNIQGLFADAHFYHAAIPTYIGGSMTFAWAAKNPQIRQQPLSTLEQRFAASAISTRYYNAAIHQAAFALPQYVLHAIGQLNKH